MTQASAQTASMENISDVEIKPFRLMRYFSGISLIGIMVVTVGLIWIYRDLSIRQMIDQESLANVSVTRVISNGLKNAYQPLIDDSSGKSRDFLLAHPQQSKVDRELREIVTGLHILKVKIYNLEGLTIYSSDAKQVGEVKADNPGFLRARGGETASAITFRDSFDAFEGKLSSRNLVSSYIPVGNPGKPINAVFEVYSDVTPLISTIKQAQWKVAGVALGMLAALYLFLYVAVSKAARIMAAQDIKRAEQEKAIRQLAQHDSLTGLPNRSTFNASLNNALMQCVRYKRVGALLFIDLDRFKQVNDTLGHAVGDALLCHIAECLRSCMRTSDLPFRMGGDEFTAILSQTTTAPDAEIIARRIIETFSKPVHIEGHTVQVGASVGIAIMPDDGANAEELSKSADAAMYEAKQRGRGQYVFFSEMSAKPTPQSAQSAELAQPAPTLETASSAM